MDSFFNILNVMAVVLFIGLAGGWALNKLSDR